MQAQRGQPKGVNGAATLITVTNVNNPRQVLLTSCIPQKAIALGQNGTISDAKGHCQGARSREPKIRSPSWAVVSRKTQSLFLSPHAVFRLRWLERAGHGQSDKHGTAGLKTLVDLKAPLNLNKELMKKTVHLQVAYAPAKLSFTKVAFVFEVNGDNGQKTPHQTIEQCKLQFKTQYPA